MVQMSDCSAIPELRTDLKKLPEFAGWLNAWAAQLYLTNGSVTSSAPSPVPLLSHPRPLAFQSGTDTSADKIMLLEPAIELHPNKKNEAGFHWFDPFVFNLMVERLFEWSVSPMFFPGFTL